MPWQWCVGKEKEIEETSFQIVCRVMDLRSWLSRLWDLFGLAMTSEATRAPSDSGSRLDFRKFRLEDMAWNQ